MTDTFAIIQKSLMQAGIPLEEIRVDASLRDDLSVDSLELIEVITVIEEQTGLSLDVRELKNIQTVAELIAFVDNFQNLRARQSGGELPMFHTEHCTTIAAPVQLVYEILADIEGYANLFPPTQSVTLLEQGANYQIAKLVVDVNGQIQSWTTRRDLDSERGIIRYRQLETAPLVRSMGGEWRCFAYGKEQTQLVLTHDFAPREAAGGLILDQYTSEQVAEMVHAAVERNSVADLTAVKQEAERRAGQANTSNALLRHSSSQS